MWSLVSGAFGAILQAATSLFGYMVENPKNTVFGIAAVLLYAFGVYGGYWYRGTQIEPRKTAWVEWEEGPSTLEQFLGGTPPDDATARPPPDSSEVDSVVIRVPKYITRTDTVYRSLPSVEGSFDYEAPDITLETRLRSNPYGFLLLPTPNGRPAVSVTADRTEIRTVDPRDASSLRLSYDHPEQKFDFGPLVRLSGTYAEKVRTSGTLGAWARFRAVRLDGGYRFSTPARTGPTLSAEWSPDINPL